MDDDDGTGIYGTDFEIQIKRILVVCIVVVVILIKIL